MLWNNFRNLSFEKSDCKDSEVELLAAKIIAVRLLITGHRFGTLSTTLDFWGVINKWLGIDIQQTGARDKTVVDHSPYITQLEQWLSTVREPPEGFTCKLTVQLQQLSERMGLCHAEHQLLLLVWLKLKHPELELSAALICVPSLSAASKIFSQIMHTQSGFLQIINPSQPLIRFRFVQAPGNSENNLAACLQHTPDFVLLVSRLEDASLAEVDPATRLDWAFEQFLPRCQNDYLGLNHFSYVPQLQHLINRLHGALSYQLKGVNILLHGKPGVGKTLLSKSVARWLECNLHQVPMRASTGDMLGLDERIVMLERGQHFFRNQRNTLVLFDEIEDAFITGGATGNLAIGKAWLNQLLESNPLPTLWLTNSVGMMDAAYLRRFDLIIEIPVANTPEFRRYKAKKLATLPITDTLRGKMATSEQLTPALIQQLQQLKPSLNPRQPNRNDKKIVQFIQQRFIAEGESIPADWLKKTEKESYRLEWLNTSIDLASVLKHIQSDGQAKMLLYGKPGTGKSEFAEYLAKYLNRTLITRSASDLLGKYIGQTEQAIAHLFKQCSDQQAILLIDEADIFLASRQNPDIKTWEVSQVNEMLIQMERFDGILIATSNDQSTMDSASVRRFDLKVQFDWLKPAQLRELLKNVFVNKPAELVKIQKLSESQLSHLCISPGNIKAACKSLQLLGKTLNLSRLMIILEGDSRLQAGYPVNPIGFIHSGQHSRPIAAKQLLTSQKFTKPC